MTQKYHSIVFQNGTLDFGGNVFLQRFFLGDPVRVSHSFSYKFKSKNHFGVFYAHLWQLLRKLLA
jgi:hypothetical protein